MEDWKTFVGGKIKPSGIKFLEEYFKWKEIKKPTLNDIRNISEDSLMNSWISIPTMKQIMLLQQQIK